MEKITAQVIPLNGESATDTAARLLSTQHERAVYRATHDAFGPYFRLTLRVPSGVGSAEVQDMAQRLRTTGAHVEVAG